MQEAGGEFLVMHVCLVIRPLNQITYSYRLFPTKHEDIRRMLHHLAISAGATVEFGVSVNAVNAGNPRPSVTLSSGRVLTADIIVGADGPTSIAREAVLGRGDDAEPEGMSMFGATVPASEMLKDPVLRRWVITNDVSAFISLGKVETLGMDWHFLSSGQSLWDHLGACVVSPPLFFDLDRSADVDIAHHL